MKQKVGEFSVEEAREIAEKKVGQRHDERVGLIAHAVPYFIVNLVVWQMYLSSGGGFPWPLFITGFWGIGMLSHFLDFYYKHGKGAKKREAEIEAEVARQYQLAQMRADMMEDEIVDTALPKRKRRLALGDDGELVDIDEYASMEAHETRRQA